MKVYSQAGRAEINGKKDGHDDELKASNVLFTFEFAEVPKSDEVTVFIRIPVMVHGFLNALFDTITGPVFMTQRTLCLSIIFSFFLRHTQNPIRRWV